MTSPGNEVRVDHVAPGGLTVVTIDRPHRRNACNGAAWRALSTIFSGLAAAGDTRVAVLAGADGHFCAGDDLKESELKLGGAVARQYLDAIEAAYTAIETAPFPVIAAVSGTCLGGGFSLSLSCDLRVADHSAFFGVPASRIGDSYPLERCVRLVSLVGVGQARRMLYSGEPVSAAEAATIGLVESLSPEDALQAARTLAETLLERAPLTIGCLKLELNAIADGEIERHRPAIEALTERINASEDRKEGIRAFAEKRPPRFSGR